MSEERQLREAYDYYNQLWKETMRRAASRRLVIRAGTLAALGGASALQALWAACGPAASVEQGLERPVEAGAYRWSKYPAIEKYNFRNLPWPMTPYIEGHHVRPQSPPSRFNVFTTNLQSWGGVFDTFRKKRYGAGANMLDEELQDNLGSVTPAPDFSYYDYKLKPGIRFHDIPPVNGRELTADDIYYCYERYRTDSIHSASLRVIDRIQVLDRYTVRIHVVRPILWLDHLLASNDYWIVAPEHAQGPEEYFNNQPIATGPFKVTWYRVRERIDSVRHTGFGRQDERWPGYPLPFMRETTYIYFADAAAAIAAYRSKQVDYRNVIMAKNELDDLLATNPESIVQVHAPNSNYNSPIGLNLHEPPLNDVRVRRALSLAINRQEIIDTVWGGFASAQHPMGYPFMGYTDPLHPDELSEWTRYDPQRAKQLLVEAGYPDGFELEFMVTNPILDYYELIAQHLEAIGVRIKWVPVESTVLTANQLSRKYKHMIQGGRISATGWTAVKNMFDFAHPESPRNVPGINDPVLNDIMERAAYTLDPDEQVRLVREFNQRYVDQVYNLEHVVGFYVFVRHPWLQNVASAVQGQFCCWGTPQMAVAWIDDTAPGGRAGRLRA